LVVFRRAERAFFVHGFAKNEQDNITREELQALRKLASELLRCDEAALKRSVASGTLTEVFCNEQTVP
jgi:hypothetical protein